MKSMNTKILCCFTLLIGIAAYNEIMAQNNTLYYMTGVPQVYFQNPATQPDCNLFFGTPLLSGIQFDVSNNALKVNDFFYKDPLTDSVQPVYLSTAGINKLISKLDKVNFISANLGINVLSFGFRSRKMYFTFDFTAHVSNRIDYPKDLLNVFTANFPNGFNYDLSSLNLDINQYIELGLGISRKFGDRLTIGIRPKLLYGISDLTTNNHSFSLRQDTATKYWNMNINSDINVCAPGVNIPTDNSGAIDWNKGIKFDTTLKSYSDYLNLLTGNKGFGVDIGLNFKPIDRLELSASLIDLGYIKWKNYTHVYTVNGSYQYQGATLNSQDSSINFDNIIDTIKARFKFTGKEGSYKTHLIPKVFVGGRYFVTPSFDVGAISRFDFNKDAVKSNIILLADWRPLNLWNVSLSYGLLDGSYSTIGVGMSFRLANGNFYIASDDIPTTYTLIKTKNINLPSPNGMLSYNLKFGFNVVFGGSRKNKLKQDIPMFYSDEY